MSVCPCTQIDHSFPNYLSEELSHEGSKGFNTGKCPAEDLINYDAMRTAPYFDTKVRTMPGPFRVPALVLLCLMFLLNRVYLVPKRGKCSRVLYLMTSSALKPLFIRTEIYVTRASKLSSILFLNVNCKLNFVHTANLTISTCFVSCSMMEAPSSEGK